MKRFVPGLLVTLMIFGSVSAKVYSNKTFLTPRSHNMNLAMEYTTWHKQTSVIDDKKFGGNLQATGFYEESVNKTDIGKYFGVRTTDCSVINYMLVHAKRSTTGQPNESWGSGWILHTQGVLPVAVTDGPDNYDSEHLADKITWRPHSEAYGVRLDYHQKLDKVLKGLFFKITVPIVHVKTSMGWSSTCGTCGSSATRSCTKQRLQSTDAFTTPTIALGGDNKSLGDYLTGCVVNTFTGAKQDPMRKARLHNGDSKTGVADIDIILGYNFLYEPTKHVNFNVGVTIPLDNGPHADYLFEATVGNLGHWAIGFGFDSSFLVWEDDKMSLDFICAFNYRYLLSGTQMRTLGFRYPNDTDFGSDAGKNVLYGHWILSGKKGTNVAMPFANYLTRFLKIVPGSHFDGIIQFAFNYDNFTLDAGYNIFAKQRENVRLKDNPCCEGSCGTGCASDSPSDVNGWTDETYAIIDPDANWDTTVDFAIANHGFGGVAINREHLNLDACTNPSVVTHKFYGGFGYAFNSWEFPVMLGLGGSFEFGTDNDCLDIWSVWAKVGVRF
jgi:hypothetical protein